MAEASLDEDELVRLMVREPRLIRRPLLVRGTEVAAGARAVIDAART